MTFADLAKGARVFLDANTLVYHFSPHPVFGSSCNELVQRIERCDLEGFTSTHVLTETAHRLMMTEAANVHGWPPMKVKQRVQKNPAALSALTRFRGAIEAVLASRIQVLTIAAALVLDAADLSRQTGLLSSDALILALMRANGLTDLASADSDFDRVSTLTRYAPA